MFSELAYELAARDQLRAETEQMRGRHLAIDHVEITGNQFIAQTTQRNFRCIPFQAEHRFAEEDATDSNAVETADELSFTPGFHRMRVAQRIHGRVGGLHFRRQPGASGTYFA